jgi:tetratricopeptide (TPR) repeat protein
VAVGLLAIAPYLRTLAFGFVFDDYHLIVGNDFVRQPWSFLKAFAHHFWHGSEFYGYYRPIVTATLALNGRMFGWSPAGFHLFNVLVHALNAALLFLLARRLAIPPLGAGLAAALFALHPAVAWPVGSIVARVDLLPAAFILLAWLACASPHRGPLRTVQVGLFFLLALLSKESAVAFLAVPLLGLRSAARGDDAESRRQSFRTGATACLASAGAILLYLALRRSAGVPLDPGPGGINPLVNPLGLLPNPTRLFAALELSGRYAAYLLVPVRFVDPHGYGPVSRPPAAFDFGVVLSSLLLAGWALGALVLWLRRDRIAIFALFSLAAFLPASNLIIPIGSLYAQNFLYLPLLGLCLALGDLFGRMEWAATRRRTVLVIATPILGLLALGSFREAGIWRDGRTLFSAWTERFPNYALAHQHLGLVLMEAGEPAQAVGPLKRALVLDDRDIETYSKLSLALMLGARGASDFEESLRLNRTAVSMMVRRLSEARTKAAQLYLDLDRPAEAEAEAREALRLLPDYIPAHSTLAESLFRGNRFADAAVVFEEMNRLNPGDPAILSPYIVSLIHAGDLREARSRTEEARRLLPHLAWFDFCLARIEAREGRRPETLELLTRCAAREPATGEWLRKVDDFEAYRGDPVFERLRK